MALGLDAVSPTPSWLPKKVCSARRASAGRRPWVSSQFLRSFQRHQGYVIFLLPALSGEGVELLHQQVHQRPLFLTVVLRDECLQTGEAEHLAFGVVRLNQSVAVEQDALAGLQDGFLLLVAHAWHKPQGHPLALSSSASPLRCR